MPSTRTRPSTGASRRTRRRFARRQWARRWMTLRYLVALLVLLALIVGGAWAVLFSSLLAVDGVDVDGTRELSPAEVRAAAAVRTGQPLARVDLDQVRNRVESLAAVRSADVTRQWPHAVHVTVEERTAVAVVDIGGRLRGMDSSGVVFKDYRKPPPALPRVRSTTSTRSDALREAARVISALPPDLAPRVDHVEVETVDQISLVLRDGRTVAWGSAEASATKAKVLAVLLRQPAKSYDVSVPGQPTTRG